MSTWKKPGWHETEAYQKLCEDERRYTRACKQDSPYCGWTCLALTLIPLLPLLWFCIECLTE